MTMLGYSAPKSSEVSGGHPGLNPYLVKGLGIGWPLIVKTK